MNILTSCRLQCLFMKNCFVNSETAATPKPETAAPDTTEESKKPDEETKMEH